jgi:hypothetical protein
MKLVPNATADKQMSNDGSSLSGTSSATSPQAPSSDPTIADTLQSFAETLHTLGKEVEEGQLSPEGRVIEAIKSIGELELHPEDGDVFWLEISKLFAYKPLTDHMPFEEIKGIVNGSEGQGLMLSSI